MTRKIALTFAIVAAFMSAKAQDKSDVLRFSETNPGGSARAQAIGGATGSIGGDYSSIFSNPAGVGFFKTSEFAFSLNYFDNNTKTTYLGTPATYDKGNFNVNSLGLIFGGKKKNNNSKWQNVSVGIGYNRLNNYNQNVYYQGRNKSSSIGSNYVSRLNGLDTSQIYTQAPEYGPMEAALTGFVFANTNAGGTLDGTWNTISPYDQGIGVLQENTMYIKGRSELYSVAVAANYDDKFYFGGNISMPHIEYDRTSIFRETNTEKYPYAGYTMNYWDATNYLHSTGNGITANLGVIYRPIPALRVGATFMAPMWIYMLDKYSAVFTLSDNTGTYSYDTYQTTNGYDDESRYTIRTPWRGIVSASYVFTPKDHSIRKPSGFLTLDYEYEDYASSSLHFDNGNSDDAAATNSVKADIKNSYKGASNIRAGGEIKLDVWSLRAGYAYYGNPYSTGNLDGTRKYYSGGLGFRNRGFYMDLTYMYSTHTTLDQPYVVGSDQQGIATTPDPATVKANASSVSLGIGFKF